MITNDAYEFFSKAPPFSLLAPEELRTICRNVLLEFHPRGRTILSQNGPAAEHLSVIRSGAVKVFLRTNEGEEVLVDYRSEGDCFGLLSFACGEVSRDTIVAETDTTCYLVVRETVLRLMQAHAPFADHCFRSRLNRFQELAYREIRDRTLLYGGGDKLLFTHVLADLATRQVVTASEDISIREAAHIMATKGISCLVLVDGHGFPSGLVTDRDLRNKVVSKNRDPGGRIGDIMSVTLIKSEARDYCYEALIKMMRYKIHHLLVVDNGELQGIITNHDLMMLQGTSPLSVAREIDGEDTVDGLARSRERIDQLTRVLIREEAKAAHITRIITEINDRLVRKLLAITESQMGPPPVSYCWIVFGSEGRKEQTFRTDQDNAIIYEEPGEKAGEASSYFSEFAARMRRALEQCGFPPCTANYMASNPQWCQPLSVWKKYFSRWISTPTPEAVLRSLIFFDFRPLYGNQLLAEQLRAYLSYTAKGNQAFLGQMAGIVLQNRPAIGIFGQLTGERSGPQKGRVNFKINALCPIIDLARLTALEAGVYHTSTVERLLELTSVSRVTDGVAGELVQAFEFVMSLRLRHQFLQIKEGGEPDNFIDPDRLSVLEKRMLKEIFKRILNVQQAAKQKYAPWTG